MVMIFGNDLRRLKIELLFLSRITMITTNTTQSYQTVSVEATMIIVEILSQLNVHRRRICTKNRPNLQLISVRTGDDSPNRPDAVADPVGISSRSLA